MTARLHPDGQVAGGYLAFDDSTTGNDVFWSATEAWVSNLPDFIDAGNYMMYEITNSSFVACITAPDKNTTELLPLLQPFLAILEARGIPPTQELYTSPDYLTHFASIYGPLPYGPFTSSDLVSNRLIPRDVVLDPPQNANLSIAMRAITKTNDFSFMCIATNAYKPPSMPSNAVLPAWRNATSLCMVGGSWDWTVPRSEMVAREYALEVEFMPALVAATPGSGMYLNEGNFAQADWQEQFYGGNYPRLKGVKDVYDPDGIFYGLTAVGSEEWDTDSDGRLCPV